MGASRWGLVAVLGWVLACGGVAPAPRLSQTPEPGAVLEAPEAPAAPGLLAMEGVFRPAGQFPTPIRPGPLPPAFPPVQATIPEYELRIGTAELDRLNAHPESDQLVAATFVVEGRQAPALVRFRGASTRALPQRSFHVELPPGYELDRRDHFALLAEYQDGGKLTEKFAVDLFEALGLPVPRARWITLRLNGRPNGVYLDMEHVGKEYLRDHGLEPDASVYRCGGRDCELKAEPRFSGQEPFTKRTNEQRPWDDLQQLIERVNRTDDALFEQELSQRLDLEAYLGNLVADALISNNLIEDAKSFWIHEHGKDRWSYVPWDLNNALMFFWRASSATSLKLNRPVPSFSAYDPAVQVLYDWRHPQNSSYRPTWSVLNTRLWDVPSTRERLRHKLAKALSELFRPEVVDPHVDALWARIGPKLLSDPYVDRKLAVQAPGYLKAYVRGRRSFLEAQLSALARHGESGLVINEIGFGPTPYVELLNRGPGPVSLDGLSLTANLRAPRGYPLPARGLLAGDRLVLDRLPLSLSSTGGELGIYREGTVCEPLDVVFFGPHPSGSAYARSPDGTEHFEEQPGTPGAVNR